MKDLKDRVAVVTGGASGIGKGMATRFAEQGMKLVIADVEAPALEKAVEELRASGAEAIGVQCDVSRPEALEDLALKTYDAYGAAHVLCNNAGVGGSGGYATWEAPLDEWDWVMGVNVMGVVHGIRSFIPRMLEGGDEGHVVNTASIAGLIPGGGIYGVSKHAVVSLSESMFTALAMRGPKIGVSVLCPGWVNTNIIDSERNRPEAPRPDPSENAAQVEMMRNVVRGLIEKGLDPAEVGNMIVDAIRTRRFYVITHPWQNMIEARMQNILQGKDPIPVPPPGMNTNLFDPPEES